MIVYYFEIEWNIVGYLVECLITIVNFLMEKNYKKNFVKINKNYFFKYLVRFFYLFFFLIIYIFDGEWWFGMINCFVEFMQFYVVYKEKIFMENFNYIFHQFFFFVNNCELIMYDLIMKLLRMLWYFTNKHLVNYLLRN